MVICDRLVSHFSALCPTTEFCQFYSLKACSLYRNFIIGNQSVNKNHNTSQEGTLMGTVVVSALCGLQLRLKSQTPQPCNLWKVKVRK